MTFPQQTQGYPQQAQGWGPPQQGFPQQQAPQGYGQPGGFPQQGGYGQPQQAYGQPGGFPQQGAPNGYPQGYGAPQQYGAPQGYAPGPVAPAPELASGGLSEFFSQPQTGGGKSVKLEPGGPVVWMRVSRAITDGDIAQQTNPSNGQPAYFKDGRPKWVMKVPVELQPDADHPDGQGQLYVAGALSTELQRAMAEVGADSSAPPEVYAVIGAQCTGTRPSGPGLNPAKTYSCVYQRPENAGSTQPAQAQVPQQATAPAVEQSFGQQAPQQGQPQQVGATPEFQGWQQQQAGGQALGQAPDPSQAFGQGQPQQAPQGFDPSQGFGQQAPQGQVPQQQGFGQVQQQAFGQQAPQGFDPSQGFGQQAPQGQVAQQQGAPGGGMDWTGMDPERQALLHKVTNGAMGVAAQG